MTLRIFFLNHVLLQSELVVGLNNIVSIDKKRAGVKYICSKKIRCPIIFQKLIQLH